MNPTPPPAERASAAPSPPSFPGLSSVVPLGSGGMGSVYRAWQDDLARAVAVKTLRADRCLDPELRAQFTREAHILAQLDHPGIVPVYLAGATDDGPFYVMRLVDGQSVDQFLEHADALEVARVFRAVAEALAAAHRAGVLHRDVTPANVLVESHGRPVLVDFGLSVQTGVASVAADAGIAGTIDYLAPEVLAGSSYAEASDIYALGATLYRVLTGHVPFPGGELTEKLRAICEADPPLPRSLRPAIPKPLQAICLKALERLPADRYASAAEMASDLGRFVNGDLVLALPRRSRTLLRRKIQIHLDDHSAWEADGLIDAEQRATLQQVYERLDEQDRGLLRGVLGSIPNLLLAVGIILTVFGPVMLLQITWLEQGPLMRLLLPAMPLALLATLGGQRWRAQDRRRAVACWFGAALLVTPLTFALADLVPAWRGVTDANGQWHPVLPGEMWLPPSSAPAWAQIGAPLLEWKLLLTSATSLAAAIVLYRRMRAAAFLWIACLTGLGCVACAALRLGWRELPVQVRWPAALLLATVTVTSGRWFDRRFQRDRARPFYGFGFVALLIITLDYSAQGVPISFISRASQTELIAWSFVFHGVALFLGGVMLHFRGSSLLRSTAALPLFAGFLVTLVNLGQLVEGHGLGQEITLVAACIAFLVTGLALHRNSLVLPAALALPISVGIVSQRHVRAVWAWSTAVVLGGAILVVLSLRLAAVHATRSSPRPRRETPRAMG